MKKTLFSAFAANLQHKTRGFGRPSNRMFCSTTISALVAYVLLLITPHLSLAQGCWSGELTATSASVTVSPTIEGSGQQVRDGMILHVRDQLRLDGTASVSGTCRNYCNGIFIGEHSRGFGYIKWTADITSTSLNGNWDVGTVYSKVPTAQRIDTTDSNSTGPVFWWFWYPGTYTFHTSASVIPATDCEGFPPPPTSPDFTVTVIDESTDDGPPACNASVGEPVNVTTGNVFLQQEDYVRPTGLRVTRSYNGLTADKHIGLFGEGWSSEYEESITLLGAHLLRLDMGSGAALYFSQPTTGVPMDPFLALAPAGTKATVVSTGGTWQVKWLDGSVHNFNSSGQLTGLVDRNNNTTSLAYDASNRLSAVTDPFGHVLTYNYSGSSKRVTSLSDSVGTAVSYVYSIGLSEVDYPDGSKLTFNYDSNYSLLWVKDGLGNIRESHTYDSNRRALTSQRDGGAGFISLNYVSSNETDVTDGRGNVRMFHYDLIGNRHLVTGITGGCNCGGADESSTWSYDASGNELSFTDGLLHTTTKSYDARGNLLSVTDPLGGKYSYTFNSLGETLTVRDPMNGLAVNTYDAPGNLLTSTTPAGNTTTYTYGAKGLLASIKDPLNHSPGTFQYDSDGNLIKQTDMIGNVTTFGYDGRGQVTSTTDPLNRTTVVTRDAVERIKTVVRPDGQVYEVSYDDAGRLVSVKDALNRATTQTWDGAYRYIGQTDRLGGMSSFIYDSTDSLTSIVDERQKTTTFNRDGHGRITKITRPDGTSESYTWDAGGRLATEVDRKGNTITYHWDAAGQLIGKDYADGTPSLVFAYDANGRMASAANGVDILSWTYDADGRIVSETSSKNNSKVTYTWDGANNRTGISLNGAQFLTYTFDADNRPASIIRKSLSYRFGYNAGSERTSIIYPNGVTTTRTFNTLGQIASITAATATKKISTASYTFDSISNRLSKTLLEYSENYLFDSKDQLTKATRGSKTTEQYTWDPAGNRLSALNSAGWGYDKNNQLLSTATASLTYDLNGNLAQRIESGITWQYYWDGENRLTKVTKNGSTVAQFAYDPIGRRVAKTAGTHVTTYIYSDQNVLQEQTGSTVSKYIHGPEVDEPLAIETGTATSYYHADAIGSILKVTNASGKVTMSKAYDAFGVPSGTIASGPAYTGRTWDSETNLYYYRARYYDPKLGRFISEDPAGLAAGLNRYAYVRNQPPNLTDPTGLTVFICKRPAKIDSSFLRFLAKLGFDMNHWWILTDKYEFGLGNAPGAPDAYGTPTAQLNQKGAAAGDREATCVSHPEVNEECVNAFYSPGRPTGPWKIYNNCQTFVNTIFGYCRF